MIAFGLMVLFPLAALLAIGVLSDCAFRATKAVKALRRQGARLQPACAARITVTSWRVVEDAAGATWVKDRQFDIAAHVLREKLPHTPGQSTRARAAPPRRRRAAPHRVASSGYR